MKLLHTVYLTLLLTASTIVEAEERLQRVVVIGDSISAQHSSWPTYLEEKHNKPLAVHSLVQGGRSIRSYQTPRDLRGFVWNHRGVAVYFLGTNDAYQTLPIDISHRHMNLHISTLLNQGFDVLIVNIPQFNVGKQEQIDSNIEMRKAIKLLWERRKTHPRLHYFDLNTVWDGSGTWDGIHPNPPLSESIAEAIYQQLISKGLL